jgi:hypothetical protein
VRLVFGLFVGAFQLFIMVNACVRSIAGKWLFGSLAGLFRAFLLVAITMASARIRGAGAEPSSAFYAGLYAGPVLSALLSLLAYRRKASEAKGSDAEKSAEVVMKSWLAVTAMDATFIVIGVAGRLMAPGAH